ncbi:MAG: putative Ig domain-containing protein [Dehalococcoidia bacterium]|nr:putative Ig domain-containing protein [Dehalococcoidia bacterium]
MLAAFLASGALVMQAMAATLVVSATTLPDAALTSAYSQTLSATGGAGSYSWSVVDGALPAGLSLNSSTGVISGTPTVVGNVAFTARVTDSDGNTASRALAIKVNPALAITTAALAAGVQSAAYTSQTLAATGGSGVYTWAIESGALPTGLTLNTSTGAITGTPSASGTANFSARVTDSANVTTTKALSITVSGSGVLTVVTASLPGATQNDAYNETLTAAGGSGSYTWTLSGGTTLPTGLSLSTAGVISGTPTGTGTSTFTVQVTDGAAASTTKQLSITVSSVVDITTTSLPSATAGNGYVQALTSTGGAAPIIWSIASGSLPAGISLSGGAGVISGVATATGTFNITLQAQDANGVQDTQAVSLTVNAPSSVNITTTTLPNGIVNNSFTYVLQRTGGVAPFTWSVTSGSLPAWLALDPSSGLLTGTPTASASAVTFTVQVQAGNGAGGTTVDTQVLSVSVGQAGAPDITTTSLPDATQNVAYSQTLSRSGGTSPWTWTLVSGSLPSGLGLSSTGVISGTPTTLETRSFTVRLTDGDGRTDEQTLSIAVSTTGGLNITTTSLSNGTQNSFYSQTLSRTGGTSPFTWTLISGSLPSGLGLSSTGVISGTPTVLQTSSFTVRVTDNNGTIDEQALSITVTTTGNVVDNGGRNDWYGPCKAFYANGENGQNNKASSFRRLIDASGATAQVKAFCDANGQKISNDDDEFRQMCNRLFSVSNTWRSRDGKDVGLRRLIEAAGAQENVRSFCQSHFGSFTGHECDDDDERWERANLISSKAKSDNKSDNNYNSNNKSNGKKSH